MGLLLLLAFVFSWPCFVCSAWRGSARVRAEAAAQNVCLTRERPTSQGAIRHREGNQQERIMIKPRWQLRLTVYSVKERAADAPFQRGSLGALEKFKSMRQPYSEQVSQL